MNPRWEIPVFDMAGRQKAFVVAVNGPHVVLVPPPGEGCRAPLASIPLLLQALRDARELAGQHPNAGNVGGRR